MMIRKIYGSKELRIEEPILFRSYLHERFWVERFENNRRAHLPNEGGFLKYNYSLLVYYVTIVYYTINHSLHNYR